MTSENGKRLERQAVDDSSTETPTIAPPPGENEIYEEPDEPIQPDERTVAETEAARESLAHPRGPRRKYKAPRSILIMLLVVAMVVTVGIYALQWGLRMRAKNERSAGETELRELEEREVMAPVQAIRADNLTKITRAKLGVPDMVVQPPGKVFTPLTPQEKQRMEALRQRWGPQWKPDEKQQQYIAEARQIEARLAATRAATQPAP